MTPQPSATTTSVRLMPSRAIASSSSPQEERFLAASPAGRVEADVREEGLEPVEELDVRVRALHEDHRAAGEEVRLSVDEPAALQARHGMSSDVGEAVLARQRRELPADGPFDPAQVDHDGLAGNPFRVLLHPADDGPGRQSQQEEVAVGEGFIRQWPVDGPAQAQRA